nr:hypothetical protein [Tanacetum cinerariifolium]
MKSVQQQKLSFRNLRKPYTFKFMVRMNDHSGFVNVGSGVLSSSSTKNLMSTYQKRIVVGKTRLTKSKVNNIFSKPATE